MSLAKLGAGQPWDFHRARSDDSVLHATKLTIRVRGTSVWLIDAEGVDEATPRQQLVSDVCRVLERQQRRCFFGVTLSFCPSKQQVLCATQ